jgi:hypothetical protein
MRSIDMANPFQIFGPFRVSPSIISWPKNMESYQCLDKCKPHKISHGSLLRLSAG